MENKEHTARKELKSFRRRSKPPAGEFRKRVEELKTRSKPLRNIQRISEKSANRSLDGAGEIRKRLEKLTNKKQAIREDLENVKTRNTPFGKYYRLVKPKAI